MLKLFNSVNLQDCPDKQIDKKHSVVKMFKDVYYSSIYRGMQRSELQIRFRTLVSDMATRGQEQKYSRQEHK